MSRSATSSPRTVAHRDSPIGRLDVRRSRSGALGRSIGRPSLVDNIEPGSRIDPRSPIDVVDDRPWTERDLRVVHLSCHRDPQRRTGEELLRAWPTLLDVARAAAGAGAEVEVLQAGWRDETLEEGGVRVRFVAERGMDGGWIPSRLAWNAPVRLLRAAREARPDVIHFQGLGFPAQTWLAASGRTPVLAQDHGDKPLPPGWRRALQRRALARAAGVAFTAAEMAGRFVEAGVLRPDARVFEVLESSSHFTVGDVEEARRETGIGGDPCLLWIGRLDANKDPLTMLDGVATAFERLPDARLWMAYHDAPLETAVRERIASDDRLKDRVTMLGKVPHARVESLCRAADLFVSASWFEGSGYALLEAVACGATPIATDIPSFRRVTRGGALGALYPPGDAAALGRRIVEIAGRPRGETRAAARAHFDRYLSFDAVGRELAAAYEAVRR